MAGVARTRRNAGREKGRPWRMWDPVKVNNLRNRYLPRLKKKRAYIRTPEVV
jgi:hypothetical protein